MKHVWELCQSCAESVYGHAAPTPEYAERAARLLYGTVMFESGGAERRQRGFAPYPENKRGAFGIGQVEIPTLRWMLQWLKQRSDVRHHLYVWLGPGPLLDEEHLPDIVRLLQTPNGDRLAVAFVRLRYFLAPGAIPATVAEQAAYWLRYYNGGWDCDQGAGRELAQTYGVDTARGMVLKKYVTSWETRCAPYVGEQRG